MYILLPSTWIISNMQLIIYTSMQQNYIDTQHVTSASRPIMLTCDLIKNMYVACKKITCMCMACNFVISNNSASLHIIKYKKSNSQTIPMFGSPADVAWILWPGTNIIHVDIWCSGRNVFTLNEYYATPAHWQLDVELVRNLIKIRSFGPLLLDH